MDEDISSFSRLGDKRGSYEICSNLLKYYHRPVKSLYDPGDVVADPDEETYHWELSGEIECAEETAKYVNEGTQTDYRESEAQTDPWDPPYKMIKVNKVPEVLSLKEFSYGNGLPATKLEVDYIIQTLENNKLSEALEGENSEKAFLKRKEILKNQIKTDWNYKVALENETQIKKLEEMKSSLINELSLRSEKRGYILKNMWNRKKEEMKKKHEKLEKKLRKEISSIEHSLQSIESDSSEILPESLRIDDPGVNVKKYILSEENMDYLQNNFSLSNVQDLLTVKDWLEKKQTTLKNTVPLPRLTKKTQRETLSEEAYQSYLAKKRTKIPPNIYHEKYKREEIPLPPLKPKDVAEFVDVDEKKIDMVTVWQQVLRGLAIQKQMLQLIERHKEAVDISLSEGTTE